MSSSGHLLSGKEVLVSGTGSFGSRYVELAASLGAKAVGVLSRSGRYLKPTSAVGAEPVMLTEEQLQSSSWDLGIIASRPSNHLADFSLMKSIAPAILIEKPLSTSPLGLSELNALSANGRVAVSAPLRFHDAFAYLLQKLDNIGRCKEVFSVCKSWLPDWRPGRNLREGYWAQPGEGGVIRDLVHELDILNFLFGPLQNRFGLKSFSAELGLAVESGWSGVLTSEAGIIAAVSLDFESRHARRYLRIEGERGSIAWDILSASVSFTDSFGNSETRTFPQDLNRNYALTKQLEALLSPSTKSCSAFCQPTEAQEVLELVKKLTSEPGEL